MRFLLTNDDGINAPGLAALERAARKFGECIVVAPAECHSGCGHKTTTDAPIRLERLAADRFVVHGAPADCTRVALAYLETEIDFVLSGINAGGNLGVDIYMSGTVAAAREAMLFGRRAIAFSQYRRSRTFDRWDRAENMAIKALGHILARETPSDYFWNVNFPDEPHENIPECVECGVNSQRLPFSYTAEADGTLRYRGEYHARPREERCDVAVCFGGSIAVSLLKNDPS